MGIEREDLGRDPDSIPRSTIESGCIFRNLLPHSVKIRSLGDVIDEKFYRYGVSFRAFSLRLELTHTLFRFLNPMNQWMNTTHEGRV